MFGKKSADRKMEQINALNGIIFEREEQIQVLEDNIARLNATISEILAKYPGIEEHEALNTYFSGLKEEIADLERDLAEKKAILEEKKKTLDITDQMIDIETERKKLETEKESFTAYKKKMFDPKDIILAAYTVPGINDVAIDAFRYDGRRTYLSGPYGDICDVNLYVSLGGSRKVGLKNDFKNPVNEILGINATIKQFITLEEACLALGSDLYLKENISALEIHSILQQFRSGFYFYGKTNITIDEFFEMLKSGKIAYDGTKELDTLLKGETR